MKKKVVAVLLLLLNMFTLPAIAVNQHSCVEMKASAFSFSMHMACCKTPGDLLHKDCCHNKIHKIYNGGHFVQANNAINIKPFSVFLPKHFHTLITSFLPISYSVINSNNNSPPMTAISQQSLYCAFLI